MRSEPLQRLERRHLELSQHIAEFNKCSTKHWESYLYSSWAHKAQWLESQRAQLFALQDRQAKDRQLLRTIKEKLATLSHDTMTHTTFASFVGGLLQGYEI